LVFCCLTKRNQNSAIGNRQSEIGNNDGGSVSGIYGLEKFSHLEDKIYRTIEQFKRERQEREALEREVLSLRRELSRKSDDKERLETQVERLLTERDAIKLKVEGMLDAIAVLDTEAVEVAKK
jgi:chromosome segregation ATPase